MQGLQKRNPSRLIAMLAILAMVVAACGGDGESTTTAPPDDSGTTAADNGSEEMTGAAQFDLSGIDITVGSKNFTEQFVLGWMMVHAFEAAGATVENQINLGGTVQNRDALLADENFVYMEYNGTGWTVHLEQEQPSFDSEELTADVREMDLAANGIQWLGRSPFNDTYGFATPPDFTSDDGDAFTLEEMAAYVEANPDASVCMEAEFPDRPDGLILMEEAYGFEVPEEQTVDLELGVIYSEIAAGNCDFGEVFTTDGRIAGLELNLVQDPGVFIIYNVSMNIHDTLYQQAPDAFDGIVDLLFEGLDEETMTELNKRVSVDGEEAEDVAREYLVDQGVIDG